MNNITEFKEVPKKYRPIPFWSWNEKLEESETAEQVRIMNNAGIGGFFMHARGGLQTEYMGEEWFDNIEAATIQAEKLGMYPWAYDENGWPSGHGDGFVCGLGVEYQQKYLRMEDVCKHTETAICKSGEHYFYYDINPFYVDVLDEKVIKKFIDFVYKPYYKRFGNNISGIFTDEPQIAREGIPWSFVFEKEYKERFGEDIYEHLEELFLPLNDYKTTRRNFWKMVTDLFSEAFCKQIYDWCDERNLQFTGHLVLEETLESQLVSNGACMPHYEYFHMPGMDWLGRNIYDCLTARQVSSVAEQLGKDLVLSESFALCGHNVSLAELKGIYEWQMVRGINMLCPHLEGYSIRGIRKRDYPPAMYKQQPWWSDFDKWVEAMSRVGMILSQGEKRAEVLLLHPQTTAWTLYNDSDNEGLEELNNKLLATVKKLEEKHISFHLGDETIMERHGRVEDGKFVIGKQKYSYVITSCCTEFLPFTEKLLAEYKAQGGQIITAEELPDMNVTGDKSLTYTSRKFDDFTVHYFVNTSADEKTANINLTGKQLDIYTGELCEFGGVHRFEPWGSLMIIDDGSELTKTVKEQKVITLDGKFNVVGKVQNAITLDFCDYYFDGELQEENGYVLNICERANRLERPVKIHQDYYVQVNDVPNELYLVCETPEKFEISVNGQTVEGMPVGYYRDEIMKKKIMCMALATTMLLSTTASAAPWWLSKYRVTFDNELGIMGNVTLQFASDGGSFIRLITKRYGESISLESYIPTKYGYTFKGWFTDPRTKQNQVTTFKFTKPDVLYAKWEPNPQESINPNDEIMAKDTCYLTDEETKIRNEIIEEKNKAYIEGFGYVAPAKTKTIIVDSDGDINKMVGTME